MRLRYPRPAGGRRTAEGRAGMRSVGCSGCRLVAAEGRDGGGGDGGMDGGAVNWWRGMEGLASHPIDIQRVLNPHCFNGFP
jgi:hypothetical protein